MRLIRPFLVGPHRDRRFIINMDQTPVYFAMNAKRTLELVGTKTIHVRTSTHDTKRATVAVTITADGTVLPLMVVFKSKPNGRIAKTELWRIRHRTDIAARKMPGWTRWSCLHGLMRSCGRMSKQLRMTSSHFSSLTATDAT